MRVYLRLLRYVRPHWRRLAVALTFLFLFALTSGASIGLVSPFMKVLFTDKHAPSVVYSPKIAAYDGSNSGDSPAASRSIPVKRPSRRPTVRR